MTGRALDDWLHRIRALHIEVEAILQSLAASLDDNPCARCTRVCCREVFCRESVESDFLRFVLGPRVEAYDENAGWFMPGAGCRLSSAGPWCAMNTFARSSMRRMWARSATVPRTQNALCQRLGGQAYSGR